MSGETQSTWVFYNSNQPRGLNVYATHTAINMPKHVVCHKKWLESFYTIFLVCIRRRLPPVLDSFDHSNMASLFHSFSQLLEKAVISISKTHPKTSRYSSLSQCLSGCFFSSSFKPEMCFPFGYESLPQLHKLLICWFAYKASMTTYSEDCNFPSMSKECSYNPKKSTYLVQILVILQHRGCRIKLFEHL